MRDKRPVPVPNVLVFKLVNRYTRLPAQREVRLRADILGSVTLHLFQGESQVFHAHHQKVEDVKHDLHSVDTGALKQSE